MLFDLRGQGRRRTVQVIYLGLAILMGGGLVLFGIGGATSGGLFDAINGNGGSGSGTSDATAAIERTATTAQAATVADPKDAAAWARLVKARFQLAGANEGVDANGTWTAAGKKRLVPVEQAWDSYVALEPNPPDDTVAGYMVQAFAPIGHRQARQGGPRARDDHRRARRLRRRLHHAVEPLHAARGLRVRREPDAQGRPRGRQGRVAGGGERAQAPAPEPRQRQGAGGAAAGLQASTTPVPATTSTTSTTG